MTFFSLSKALDAFRNLPGTAEVRLGTSAELFEHK